MPCCTEVVLPQPSFLLLSLCDALSVYLKCPKLLQGVGRKEKKQSSGAQKCSCTTYINESFAQQVRMRVRVMVCVGDVALSPF